jgi:aminoglycoside phosphotransferase (APT) family kinase protein
MQVRSGCFTTPKGTLAQEESRVQVTILCGRRTLRRFASFRIIRHSLCLAEFIMPLALLDSVTAFQYLSERNLAIPLDERRIRVWVISRRNHNVVVEVDGRPTWFIKQIQYPLPEVAVSLAREACFYVAAQNGMVSAQLTGLLPKCILFDPENSVLVLECLNGVDAAEAHNRVGRFDTRIAHLLGQILAAVHSEQTSALYSASSDPHMLPWVLRPYRTEYSTSLMSIWVSNFEADSKTATALDRLRSTWTVDALMHGDARPDNFVLCPGSAASAFDIKLVDWELAGRGEALWDCAGVLQYYWVQWAEWTGMSAYSWQALRSAVIAFWESYCRHRHMSLGRSRGLLVRAISFTGARLIQSAYEASRRTPTSAQAVQRLSDSARLLLQNPKIALGI